MESPVTILVDYPVSLLDTDVPFSCEYTTWHDCLTTLSSSPHDKCWVSPSIYMICKPDRTILKSNHHSNLCCTNLPHNSSDNLHEHCRAKPNTATFTGQYTNYINYISETSGEKSNVIAHQVALDNKDRVSSKTTIECERYLVATAVLQGNIMPADMRWNVFI